jgi:predicted phosphodiesterase
VVILCTSFTTSKSVTDKFPKVKTVQGDNDSSDLLKEEASKADIVIREFHLLSIHGSCILIS